MFGNQQVFMDQLDADSATAQNELGTLRYEDGNRYMYVQNAASTDTVDKQAVIFLHAADYTITPTCVATKPIAGIAQSVISAGQYGWIQVGGMADATNRASDVDDGVQAYCASTTGVLAAIDGTAQGSAVIVAYGVADATSNVAKVYINL